MSSKVRVWAVADVHGEFSTICKIPGEPCVVLVAGDVSKDGDSGAAVRDLNRQFLEWLNRYPMATFVVIGGNHDKFLQKHYAEMSLGPNATFLCDSACATKDGLKIYGTSWCIGKKQIFECASGFRQMMFAKIPQGLDVLITHAPPLIPGNGSFENASKCMMELTEKMLSMENPPKVIVCGHFHDGSGAEGKIICKNGKIVRVYNVAKITKEIAV